MNAPTHLEAPDATSESPARVLIVDDTPANVKLLEDLLGFHGYEVEVAATGEEALEIIATRMPELVLLDLSLIHI